MQLATRGSLIGRDMLSFTTYLIASFLLLTSVIACRRGGDASAKHPAITASRVHIGRLTFNCPATPAVYFRKTRVSDIDLSWDALGAKSMNQWLAERTAEIRAGKLSMDRPSPLLRSFKLPDGLPVNLFWSLPNSEIRRLEGYRQVGNSVLILGTDGFESELTVSEQLTAAVAESFRPVAPGTGGTPGGFGVEDGVIQRPFDNNEFAEADLGFLDNPALDGLKLSVNTHVYANAAPSTLPGRASRGRLPGLLLGVRTLREGKRTVAGLAGQELFQFARKAGHNSELGVHAEFEFGGDANDPLRPYLQIMMDAEGLPTGTKPADLLQVWDTILQSAELHN